MRNLELGQIIAPAQLRRAGEGHYPVLSMTMRDGLVNQADKFTKRVASADTSQYKVVGRNQLVVGFPIDEGVLAFQRLYDAAIVSPAYNVWDLRDGILIDTKYLERFLRSPLALSFYKSKLRNTTARRRTLPNDIFLSLSVPVPPLAEQNRIVMLLDEADELRKLRGQADRRTAALLPAHFTGMFGDPTYLQEMRWPFKLLGEFAKVSYGLADKLDAATKPENGTRILTISNVLLNGSIDTQVEKYSVVQPAERAKARLRKFDLLFNWRNGSEQHVGKAAIWEEQIKGEVLHVSFLLRIRTDQSQANPYFLWALINRLRATGYFMRNARMQINRKFNASELSALKVPLPPLDLQNEFARRVTELRELEAVQGASRQRLDALFQSLLHRAFAGEL